MKTHPTSSRLPRLPRPAKLSLAAAVAAVLSAQGHAASIQFGAATTISGDPDVFNLGSLVYAYDWTNLAVTVNGVAFAGNGAIGTNLSLTGFNAVNNTAFNSGAAPYSGLTANYQNILKGATYVSTTAGATVTMNNLLAGHVYAAQFWVNDPRPITGRAELITSVGGNTVALAYSAANVAGSPGQFTVGGFTADSASQTFSLTGTSTTGGSISTQMNALQVRDVTGVWSGAVNGTWDGGTANFTGGNIFATVSGLVNQVSFGDTDGFRNAVTNSNITIGAGGVNIGTVNLQNNALAYTFNSAGSSGFTGATVLNKTGTGIVNLVGAHTHTGNTTVSAGSLVLKDTNALQNSTLTTGNIVFDSSVGSNAFTLGGLSGSGAISLLNNASAPVALTVGNNGASTTHSGVLSGAGGSLTKTGNGTLTLTGANTYTGATTVAQGKLLVNGSASGSAVSVNAGTTLGGTGTVGAATVAGGGAIEAGANGTGKLTLAGLNFSGAGTINFGSLANYAAATGVQVTGAGALSLGGGANSVLVSINNLAGITLGTPYRLVGYSGAIGGAGFGGFQLGVLPSRGVGSLSDTGTEIRLTVTSTDFVKWTGAGSLASGWNTSALNWKLNSDNSPTAYIDSPGDSVVFDDDALPGNTTVNVNDAAVSPSSVTFNNNTNTYTVQGAFGIAGLTTLAKAGTGTTILAAPNTYSGQTTVTQGALNIRHASALGSTLGNTVVSSGGALEIQGGITTAAEALTLNGTGVSGGGALRNISDNNTYAGLVTLGSAGVRINSDAGTLTLSNTGTITGAGFGLTVGGAGNTTIQSIIGTGAGTLTKDGSGTVALGAANTYTGATTISGGTLQVGVGATGSLAAGSTITNNGTLVLFRNNNAAIDPVGVINGTGSVTYTGGGTLVSGLGQFTANDANSYSGGTSITNSRVNATNATAFGTGPITVQPGGQVYISGALTFANPITLNGDGWAEGAGLLGALRLQAGTYSGPVTLGSNARISSYGGSGTISGVISGAFNLETTGQSTANVLTFSGVNTYTGATTITSGTLSVATIGDGGVAGNLGQATSDAFNLVLNGGVLRYSGATASTNRNFTIGAGRVGSIEVSNAATNLTISGGADFSTGSFQKLGAGTLTLTGAHNYLGATTGSAGTLVLAGATLSTTGDFTVGNTTATAATVNLTSGTVIIGGANLITASAASTPTTTVFNFNQSGGTFDFTNSVGFIGISNNGGTTNFAVTGGTFTALNGSGINLGVRGNGNLNVGGTGVVAIPALTFGHPSTTGGSSTVNLDGGTLQVGAGRVTRASGTATFNFNGGTLQPTAASTTFLNGLNNVNVRNGGAIIDTNGLDITIGQSLLHSSIGGDNAIDGGLQKKGAGTLTLSGLNNYTGTTSVINGKLLVTGSLNGAGAVSVASGATLAGSGSAGNVTVASGGSIEAGVDGSGLLTLNGLTFSGSGTLNLGTLTNYSATPGVQVSGINALVTSGGANSVSVNVANLTGIATGTPYKVLSYSGTPGGAGFAGFQVAPLPNRAVGVLSDTGSEIRLTITSTDFVKWTGAGSLGNGWETATQNWVLNSTNAATTYLDSPADAVVFDDSAAPGNTTVNIDVANVNPSAVTFNNSTNEYTLQGAFGIGGIGNVTKNGTGVATLSTANSYTGTTTINAGTLRIQNNDALGSTVAGTTVASGGALELQGFLTTAAEALTINGTGVANGGALRNLADTNTYSGLVTLGSTGARINSDSGALILNNAGTITGDGFGLFVGGAGDTTIGSVIGTGAGNLVKDGAGVLTLSAANTFSGGVAINEGIIKAGNPLALGAAGNSITIASGGALDVGGQALQGYTQRIFLSGAGAVSSPTLGALGNTGADNLNAIRDIELLGDTTLGGDGGRWDIGRVDFNVDPANTVDHITGNGFTITKVGISYLGLLTGAANVSAFNINGGIVAPHENTSFGSGPVTVNNGGTVKPWGGPTFANPFILAGGTLTEADGFTDTYNGTVTVTATSTLTPVNGNIILNGAISGAAGLVKNGAFSVLLNGDNSGFTGTYTNDVSNTFFNTAISGSAAASFVVNGGNLAATAGGALTVELGSLAGAGGNLGNNSAGSLVTYSIGGNNTDTSFAGSIVDSVGGGGTTSITKIGTGELTLTGVLSYTEVTTITDGTLTVNSALGTGANVVDADGGVTNFNANQVLAELNIADGAVVTLGSAVPPPAPGAAFEGVELVTGTGAAAVPEPGVVSLLMLGALGFLGRRRRNA